MRWTAPTPFLKKAKADFDKGDYRWVMQVLMQVVYADPGNMGARNLMADASEQLGYQAEAGSLRGWYLSAAKDLREGVKPLPVLGFASPDTVAAMPLELFFDYLSIRLDGCTNPWRSGDPDAAGTCGSGDDRQHHRTG